MTGFITRGLGALVVTATLLAGCAGSGTAPGGQADRKPDLTRALLDAAATALAHGDAATAVTYYRDVCQRDPADVAAAIGLMRSLRLAGGLDEARGVAARTLAAHPHDHDVLAEAGKVRLAAGEAEDAIPLLQRAAAGEPHDWQTRSALGLAYDRLGQYDRADASYEAALAIAPGNAAVLNNFALSRAMAGDFVKARALAQRAAAAAGADLRVRQNLALIYALSGNMTQAAALTRRDLPPPLARATLDYYRQLAAATVPDPAGP